MAQDFKPSTLSGYEEQSKCLLTISKPKAQSYYKEKLFEVN